MQLTSPGPTLGVVGGGQLGRMLGEAAGPLGVDVVVADPTPDCPASAVVRDQVEGGFADEDTLFELADRADVLTYEIELADPDALEGVRAETGTPVHPDPATLRTTGDKLREKERLADAGIPVPAFRPVDEATDLRRAGETLGWPVMLKARRGGYDGRGNVPVAGPDEVDDAIDTVGGPALAEVMIPFDRELAVMGVRGDDRQATFPVTETIHETEILRETVSPARTDPAIREEAQAVARTVLDILDGRGVFGIELFEVSERSEAKRVAADGTDSRILVNEIAPRPHNSGHWTIEGCLTSQFAQHIRAVLGWPLGATDRRCPTASANLLGDVDSPQPAALSGFEAALESAGVTIHWYGKREARPLRKMGHLTAVDETGGDGSDLLGHLREIRAELTFRSAD